MKPWRVRTAATERIDLSFEPEFERISRSGKRDGFFTDAHQVFGTLLRANHAGRKRSHRTARPLRLDRRARSSLVAVRLPFDPPLAPMLSRSADALPDGEGWQFEPKWDGFRTLVFRDGDEIVLQSRDSRPMNRYFPELVEPLAAARCPSAASSTARS